MIFLYLDESGTLLGNKDRGFFVLSAVAIPAQHWSQLDEFLHDLLTQKEYKEMLLMFA